MQQLSLDNIMHVDGINKILVCICCGCPCPDISHLVPDGQGAESPAVILTLLGTENMGSVPGRLCSLVLCYGPMFPRVFEH